MKSLISIDSSIIVNQNQLIFDCIFEWKNIHRYTKSFSLKNSGMRFQMIPMGEIAKTTSANEISKISDDWISIIHSSLIRLGLGMK